MRSLLLSDLSYSPNLALALMKARMRGARLRACARCESQRFRKKKGRFRKKADCSYLTTSLFIKLQNSRFNLSTSNQQIFPFEKQCNWSRNLSQNTPTPKKIFTKDICKNPKNLQSQNITIAYYYQDGNWDRW